ncbi:Lrp/AsnC family transcriptional regulator [Rhodobacteraceae bacterium CCMM004]|nr:Lrp/AsnC family transcriptional regulator [Rhodobacteraceae bacterium CCMM004]
MDKTDSAILTALRRDARATVQEVARAAGVSRATVRSRMAAMQARGDIRGFTVLTAADLAPSPVRGLMMLAIEGAGADRLAHRLTGLREVQAVHSTNGSWDLIVELGTDTLEALDRVLFEIRRLPGVTRSETNLLLSTRTARGTGAPDRP